jgi:hypothetical protein
MSKTKSIMQNKTSSKIPKTATQKIRWIKSRKLVAKQSGSNSEKQPWGLVNHIYQQENKAGKTIKNADVKNAKKSKSVSKYKKTK